MALIGVVSGFMIMGVVTTWLIVKAGTWQLQADVADEDIDTTAPRVVLDRGLSVFKIVVVSLLVSEFGAGIASWVTDAVDWGLSLL